jgi:hypothetical protein
MKNSEAKLNYCFNDIVLLQNSGAEVAIPSKANLTERLTVTDAGRAADLRNATASTPPFPRRDYVVMSD